MYTAIDIKSRCIDEIKDHGYSVQPFLISVGLSKSTLDGANKSMPKADTLAKIADGLNLSVDYLLGRSKNKYITTLPNDHSPNIEIEYVGHPFSKKLEFYTTPEMITRRLDEIKRDQLSDELVKRFEKLSFENKIEIMSLCLKLSEKEHTLQDV